MSANSGTHESVPVTTQSLLGAQSMRLDAEGMKDERKRIESIAKRDGLDDIGLNDLDGLIFLAQEIHNAVAYVNDVVNYVTAKKGLKVTIIIQEAPSILGRKTFPEITASISREL